MASRGASRARSASTLACATGLTGRGLGRDLRTFRTGSAAISSSGFCATEHRAWQAHGLINRARTGEPLPRRYRLLSF